MTGGGGVHWLAVTAWTASMVVSGGVAPALNSGAYEHNALAALESAPVHERGRGGAAPLGRRHGTRDGEPVVKKSLAVALGILTVIGGFVDIGDLVPEGDTWPVYFYSAIALFGAAMTPYEVLFFSSGGLEKHWSEQSRRTRHGSWSSPRTTGNTPMRERRGLENRAGDQQTRVAPGMAEHATQPSGIRHLPENTERNAT